MSKNSHVIFLFSSTTDVSNPIAPAKSVLIHSTECNIPTLSANRPTHATPPGQLLPGSFLPLSQLNFTHFLPPIQCGFPTTLTSVVLFVVANHTSTVTVRLKGWTSSPTRHQGDDYEDKHVQRVTYPQLASVLHCLRVLTYGE